MLQDCTRPQSIDFCPPVHIPTWSVLLHYQWMSIPSLEKAYRRNQSGNPAAKLLDRNANVLKSPQRIGYKSRRQKPVKGSTKDALLSKHEYCWDLNRPRVARKIFSSGALLTKLNSLTLAMVITICFGFGFSLFVIRPRSQPTIRERGDFLPLHLECFHHSPHKPPQAFIVPTSPHRIVYESRRKI